MHLAFFEGKKQEKINNFEKFPSTVNNLANLEAIPETKTTSSFIGSLY